MTGPRVVKVDPDRPHPGAISEAVHWLATGRLVAFPTETVYGLGASAALPQAVSAVYQAKRRPADNPLILHLADASDLAQVAAEVPQAALKLSQALWPGPLTLIVEAKGEAYAAARAGLPTVAVRVPNSALIREIVRALGAPVAAPSANRSGRPSATRAVDVLADLSDAAQLALVLDGGPCPGGVESTVVDVTTDPAVVLRPGGMPIERLLETLGPNGVIRPQGQDREALLRRSPGTRHRHYAPSVPVVLVETAGELQAQWDRLKGQGLVGVLASDEALATLQGADAVRFSLGPKSRPAVAASRVFIGLRQLESAGVVAIVAELPEERLQGWAVADRLRRAAEIAAPRPQP